MSRSQGSISLTPRPIATVKNNTLYIDGGLETYVDFVNGTQLTGNITLGYSECFIGLAARLDKVLNSLDNYLIEIDLSGSWDWTTNISEKYLDKIGNPNTASSPVLVRGALYQGPVQDDHIYLYGGTTSWWNTSSPGFEPPTSAQYSLWSYDTALAKWNQSDISSASPSRPNGGALAEAPELGLAFYFNGQIDNGSSTETQDLGVGVQIFLDDMIVINMTDRTARNLSTLAVTEGQPTILGGLQYVSGIGEKGILIHLGGLDKDGKFVSL